MLWLSLNFYQLPLDVFLLKSSDSTLQECEFAVVENGYLAYCNQAAIDKGLETGMKVSTAYALSSELKIKQRNYDIEKNMLTQLATLAYGFSSQVCLYNEQTILLEVQASCKLFTNLGSLLEQLVVALSALQVKCFSALAATPKAAYLLGLYQQRTIGELVSSARGQSLSGLNQESRRQLDRVPIAYLSYESASNSNIKVEKVRKMGIRILGELINLPGSAIGRRFGKAFLHYLYCLKGDIKDPQDLFSIPEKFSIQRCFVNGLDTIEQVLFPAKAMLDSLSIFLKIRRVMAVKIVWRLHCFNGDELFFEIDLSSEVQNTEQLMMLTRLKLQTFILQEKVETVFLESKSFIALKEKQAFLGLNDNRTGILDGSGEVGSLMDKLNVRLGSARCSKLLYKDEHLPEKLSPTVSVLDEKALGMTGLKSKVFEQVNEQPLWLLKRPEEIGFFQCQNDFKLNYRGDLSITSNAEKIENGWWDNEQLRDYYIAKNNCGVCYWVYYDLIAEQWLLHGVF